jgi:hypothetical protein
VASLSLSMLSLAQEYSRAKIHTDSRGLQQLAELGIAIDHGHVKQDTYFISDLSVSEIQQVRDAGFEVDILIPDVKQFYIDRNAAASEPTRNTTCSGTGAGTFIPEVPANFNLGSMAGFYTYQEFLDEIDAMAAQYPNLITVKAPISTFTTIEGRPLYYLRMSDNPNSDETGEPEILYTAIHHAREPQSLSQLIFYMWYLLENYDNSEEIQFLLDNSELYFVPMINPDGYIYNEVQDPDGGGMWRKNRRDNGGGDYGVDLNRNYSYGWGTTGISMDPGSDVYPGTGAFSEAETQAIRWFCENRDFIYAFNAHTYADDILHPIGTTDAEFAEDHDYFQAFTHHMVKYNGYQNLKSSDLYPASGDSDDYMYKEDTVQKPKIFAMTPEIGSDGDGFWPASVDITPIAQEMVFPNLILAHLAHKYVVVEDSDPSTVETMSGNFNHSAYRLGQENGPVTVSIEPLEGIQNVGAATIHDLEIMENENAGISYVLDPAIQFGDPIRYVLSTEYGLWTKRDTIEKTYGAITSQFIDDATNTVNWTGNWTTTTATYVSPSKSFTESASGNYQNNITRTYTYNQTVDLTNATAAGVRFYAQWAIEPDYDYCQFQVSTDGGTNWEGQCGLYTNAGSSADGVQPEGEPLYDGTQNTWVLEEIDLSDYLGQSVNLRFIFQSDGGVRMDGYYFDDFQLLYNIDDAGTEENALGMKSMPNPANTYAQIGFGQPVSAGTIHVYSLSGGLVHTETISGLTNKIMLNTAAWNEGMYTIVYTGAEKATVPTKLVVVH